MNTKKNIAFLGLGVMGAPMAGHLARAGHRVTVFNRTSSRASEWIDRHRAEGLDVAMEGGISDAAAGQDIVLSCVGNDADLAEVVLGPQGALAAMRPGALFVDHTTVSATIARQISAEADQIGLLAVDAPVSGGQSGAEGGKLSIMCGGSEAAFSAAEPIMQAYAARIVHIGQPGAGQTAKMVNQTCIAGVLAGLSEAIRLGQAAELDMDKVLQAISGGAAQSWQMENRWPTMVSDQFEFGFAVDWMRKDLGIALAEGKVLGLEMPVTGMVDEFYGEVQELGGGRQDTSALIRRLPRGKRT